MVIIVGVKILFGRQKLKKSKSILNCDRIGPHHRRQFFFRRQKINFELWLLGDKTGPHCDHCLRHLLAPSLGDTGKFLKYISRFQVSFNFFFFPQLFNLFLTQLALISQPPGTQQSNTLVSNCTYHPLLIISYLWWLVNHDN